MNRIVLLKILIIVLFQSVNAILNPNLDDGGNIYSFCTDYRKKMSDWHAWSRCRVAVSHCDAVTVSRFLSPLCITVTLLILPI
jgi:hypothetical protein